MTAPTYGIIIQESVQSPVPVMAGDFSVVGILCPIDDANTTKFPLNTPIAFNSTDISYTALAGTGHLADALTAINNQLQAWETAVSIIAVLVPNASDVPTQIANLLGDSNALTGLYTFKKAGILTGFIPRILVIPGGFTGYVPFAVTAPNLTAGGFGYTHASVTFTPAGPTATATVSSGGAVNAINMTAPGSYPPGTTVTAAIAGDGTGAHFTFTLAPEANPLVAALPAVCNALLAVAPVAAPGDGVIADSYSWRQTMSSDRLIPLDAWMIAPDGGYSDGLAEFAGTLTSVDFQHGGLPGWSAAGQSVQGILGLKTYYSFSLTDGATQGQQLLAQQIGVCEPGVIGSDTAIASAGYVWASVFNAAVDPRVWFYNKRRMKDFVNLALVKAIRLHLGKENVTPHGVQAVLNDMVNLGSYLLSRQISLGFQVSFTASENSPSMLQQGQFTVDFANEVPAPITQVTVNSSDDFQALVVELQTIVAQAATNAPQYLTE